MKRSEVNRVVAAAASRFRSQGIPLPEFADWRPEDWLRRTESVSTLMAAGLGWDVVEWPPGPFETSGLLLFTLRNVTRTDPSGCVDGYAEKLMLIRPEQRTPLHTHRRKMEDLINRGGGRLVIELVAAETASESLSVILNGTAVEIGRLNGIVELCPGDSVTLVPGVYHSFYARDRDVVAGEVSTYNDDAHDNVFVDPIERFPAYVEDEPPQRLVVADYPRILGTSSFGNA